jgi:putative transposase
VQPAVDRVFREFGLPRAIRSDNGSPFASSGAGGLSRLAVHWLKLGITLERIEPGAPQQNGRHERMHATLKAETARPPADSAAEQQARFDAFRRDFNDNRPHEALGQVPPPRRYQPSPRPFPDKIEEPWYDPDHATRRVRPTGEIKWGGDLVFVSEALAGETVGVAETEDGDWIVRFAAVDLGLIDRTSKKLRRFAAGRPSRRKAQPEQIEKTVNHVTGP